MVSAPGSFLFSLLNHDDLLPFKAPLKEEHQVVIISDLNFGPVFGLDLRIGSSRSSTDFGDSFQTPPGYAFRKDNTQSFLAGSFHFNPEEVEVFYLK